MAVAHNATLGKANSPGALPDHILALSTMRQRPPPTPEALSAGKVTPTWEQRTVVLEGAAGRTAQEVFEGLVRGRSPLGEVWLDSARVRPCNVADCYRCY